VEFVKPESKCLRARVKKDVAGAKRERDGNHKIDDDDDELVG